MKMFFLAHRWLISAETRDEDSNPPTLLRKGLMLGQIRDSAKLKHYDKNASDGSEWPIAYLNEDVDLVDPEDNLPVDTEAAVLPYPILLGDIYQMVVKALQDVGGAKG